MTTRAAISLLILTAGLAAQTKIDIVNQTSGSLPGGRVSGAVATASALAANGANCTAGQTPVGVDASGAAEGCVDVATQAELDAAIATLQPIDSDLTAIAALACTNGQIIKRAGGVWTCAADDNSGSGTVTARASVSGTTPTYTRTAPIQQWTQTLSASVTSSTLSGAVAGDELSFEFTQGASPFTVALPTGFPSLALCSTNGSVTIAKYFWTGSAAVEISVNSPGCTERVIRWQDGTTSTFPAGSDTVVTLAATQTLTNKSISASQVNSGQLAMARIASGTPDGTKFVRDDGTLAVPSGGASYNVEGCFLTNMCAPPHTGTRQAVNSGVKGFRFTISGSLIMSRLVYLDLGAAGDFVSGIWADSNGAPTGTMITNTGCKKSDTNDGAGWKTITCDGATLTAGTYHFLYDWNTTSNILTVSGVSVAWATEFGDALTARWAYSCSGTSTGSGASRALPAGCVTQSDYGSNAIPVFYISSRP